MDDDLARLRSRLGLKTDAKPAMRFAAILKTARCDSIGEDEECFFGAEFLVETLDEKIVLVVEHRSKTHAANVTVGGSVNGVAECHIVGRHGLGDCAGCAAYAKESARYLLAAPTSAKVPYFSESKLI